MSIERWKTLLRMFLVDQIIGKIFHMGKEILIKILVLEMGRKGNILDRKRIGVKNIILMMIIWMIINLEHNIRNIFQIKIDSLAN